ncbi:HNH endonuclease signature motif containing protein [Occultella kanbiaonis]|uniref:HNH endonuclease signature motif containing protein n=1 Tax=Occultella kanbiaonis TaxID=2675754 RepID=UPI0013CFD7D9|nr:HNH endonuclease signature motif containing protein [Occultella kanbiaonis]
MDWTTGHTRGDGVPADGTSPAVDLASDPRREAGLGALLGGSLDDRLFVLDCVTAAFAATDRFQEQHDHTGRALGEASVRAHRNIEILTGRRLDWLAAERAEGLWDLSGKVRTYTQHVARTHKMSFARASREVRLADRLSNDLPEVREALRTGQLGIEQAGLIATVAASSAARRAALRLPARGMTTTTQAEPQPGETTPTGDTTQAGRAPQAGDAPETSDGPETSNGPETGDVPKPGEAAQTGETAGEADGAAGEAGGEADAASDAAGDAVSAGPFDADATAESVILTLASAGSFEDLRVVCKYFAALADAESDERGYREACEREFFDLAATTGGFHLSGFLTEEHGQLVKETLTALTPVPAAGDTRTASQRRAQALADAAQLILNQGLAGTGQSVRPHMGVLISAPEFEHILATSTHHGWGSDTHDTAADPTGAEPGDTEADPTRAEAGVEQPGAGQRGAGQSGTEQPGTEQPGTEQAGAEDPGADIPDWARMDPDADPAAACDARPVFGRDLPPLRPGTGGLTNLKALEHVDWAAILSQPPATWADGTGPVPPSVLRRIACGGEIYRVIFGPDSEIINVGRAHRRFTNARRRAMVARDRHCTYPGCAAPPPLCEGHHSVVHWADGGSTDLNNGALLCFYHHRYVDTHQIAMIWNGGEWQFFTKDGEQIHGPGP